MEYGYETGTGNIRSSCRAGSLVTVSNELSKYKLDLVTVQEVRWEVSGNKLAENTHFCMERE
jgi:hypothetical protein